MKTAPFEIAQVYQAEAHRLINARRSSKIIHKAGDIDASGDELEQPFREFLQRRLPAKYFVGHGHIVDRKLNVSPQFDVIIADNTAAPILFEAENGTQFFPYESVYAVGEIKSTYVKSKRYIESFSKSMSKLYSRLEGQKTPVNYIGGGLFLDSRMMKLSDSRAYRNPLFHFFVAFDKGDSDAASLLAEYSPSSNTAPPAMAIFLCGQVIAKAKILEDDNKSVVNGIAFDPIAVAENKDLRWMNLIFTDEATRNGQTLALLMVALSEHLNTCVLMNPPFTEYMDGILNQSSYEGFVAASEDEPVDEIEQHVAPQLPKEGRDMESREPLDSLSLGRERESV